MNFAGSKKLVTSEMVWWVKLRPMTPELAFGIVGLADARQQQKLHVEDGKGGQDHQIGGLFPFIAVGIDERDAGSALAEGIDIDPRHLAVVARRKIRLAQQRRQDRGLRRRFGVIAAAEPFAESAKGAGSQPHAKRILIRHATYCRTAAETACSRVRAPPLRTGLDRTAVAAAGWDRAASAAPRRDCRPP